ncbi:MAG TPA: hypothetical protein PKW79_00660 [Rhabdochlamydiaceae bacterium]|nr:hypothetical protein [Rhabdochlamydiaceae bacterium]
MREKIHSFVYKMKTLPDTQPRFASSLCSMVCLWLVLIPALIMAIKGIEFSLARLTFPVVGAVLLAAFLFSRWRMLAIEIKNSEAKTE